MPGWDHFFAPCVVMYALLTLPGTLMEVFCYYTRGGLVGHDVSMDESFNPMQEAAHDNMIYRKRFCDRPESEAAKAFYAYLDWSCGTMDKSIVQHRRNLARGEGDQMRHAPMFSGPFIFNHPKKQWMRGDDAAAFRTPHWGHGGEERAREEYQAAKDKGFDRYWHYKVLRKIRREKANGTPGPQENPSNPMIW